jgi:hypothetical protein
MNTTTTAPKVTGTKPRQYDGRRPIFIFADGSRAADWYPNASAQGMAIKAFARAGRQVVEVQF